MWGKFENLPYVLYFHPSWRAHAPIHNSFENTFVHEGHEGTRRKIFVSLRVLGGYFHPSWRAHAPMNNSFENVGANLKNLPSFIRRGGCVRL